MVMNISDPRELTGATVTGDQGATLGKVENVYVDDATQRAEWAAVRTGMFDSHVSLVPLAAADYREGALHLPYDKDQVSHAPHHDPDQELSVEEEKRLFAHYGVAYNGQTATAQPGQDQQARRQRVGDARRDRVGETGVVGSSTGKAMTRSEEQLRVGTESHESGRARLRKYVVTEQQTVSVPVSHEEARVEREPIPDADAAAVGSVAGISEEEHEVVLHEERPVVEKETVAKERVRMSKDTHTKQEQVSGEVRKERIDAEGGARSGHQQDGQR